MCAVLITFPYKSPPTYIEVRILRLLTALSSVENVKQRQISD